VGAGDGRGAVGTVAGSGAAGIAPSAAAGTVCAGGHRPARIGFLERVPRSLYYSLYHQIDLCLDTFPYTGHTTTIDCAVDGRAGGKPGWQTAVSRGGLSICPKWGSAIWSPTARTNTFASRGNWPRI